MLDAATQLLAERGVGDVTVRDIATRAGVSHALVHRYLGSKEKILGAVLLRSDTQLAESAEGATDLTEAAFRMLGTNREASARHMRLVANAAIAGVPFERLGITFPATRRLFEFAERACAESRGRDEGCAVAPNVLVAGMVAMAIGWTSTRSWLPTVMSLDDPDAELESLVALLVRAAVGDQRAGRP